MRFASFALCLLAVFAVYVGIASAADALTFKWLPGTVTLDNKYYSATETCDAITADKVTVRRGYRDKNLYFYFTISDMTNDAQDAFTLKFDTNGDGLPSDSEPNVLVYRNGAVQATDEIQVFVDNAPARSWSGKILVPFWKVDIPWELPLQNVLPTDGPVIWFKGYDAGASLGAYPHPTAMGPTTSAYHWAQPEALVVDVFDQVNPDKQWTRETDDPKVEMLVFGLESNKEEPIHITSFIISSAGNGIENEHVKAVEAYVYEYGEPTLIGSKTFASDNGQITFPADIYVSSWNTAEKALSVAVYYIMDSDAGYVKIGDAMTPGTFSATLTAIAAQGEYTLEQLGSSKIPYTGGMLTAVDCKTNNGCADDELCAYSSCRDVLPLSDCGYAANHQWNDYACCVDATCGADKVCSNNVCVAAAEPAPTCSGTVSASMNVANNQATINVAGLSKCDNKMVYVKSGSCTGTTMCSFVWIDGSNMNKCTFQLPAAAGTYTYYTCMDVDGNGAYALTEQDSNVVVVSAVPDVAPVVEPEPGAGQQPSEPAAPSGTTCTSTGCDVASWTDCQCEAGSTAGIMQGRCRDNCGEVIYKTNACTCRTAQQPSTPPTPVSPLPTAPPASTTVPPSGQPAPSGQAQPASQVPVQQSNQQMILGILVFLAVVLLILAVGVLMHYMQDKGRGGKQQKQANEEEE